jgi:putative redox protein
MTLTEFHVKAKLIEDFRIDVDDQRAHVVALDQPIPDGADMGSSALELCLMSFAGCYATIFALVAKKMRFLVKDLEIKVDGVKTEEAGTITETKVDIFVNANVARDRIQRAHELTVKGCPVGKLFEKANVKITYSLRTTGD